MKRRVLLLTVAATLVLWTSAQAVVEFVGMGSAKMLVITHDDLRTPDWVPGMNGAWETILLDQKAQQGISVAILDIGDGVSASEIRDIISDSCGSSLRYLYIIGDADRQEVDARNPQWPESDADSNRFVPFYGQDVDPQALNESHYPLENDLAYVDGLTGMDDVEVGRLPAQNTDEILIYLEKCDTYLNLSNPAWAKKQLLAIDDWNHPWVNCSGSEFRSWAYVLANRVPATWTSGILLTSEIRTSQASRDAAFANQVNNGYGLVFSLGVASHMNNLSYFWWGTSNYENFDNTGMYPLLCGFNCSIGAIQRPDSCHYDTVSHQIDGIFWDYNVVENLLFFDNAGIIAALAPTQWTICDVNRYLAKKTLDFLVDDHVYRFGSLWRRLVSLRDTSGSSTIYSVGDWHYENIVLLGDPSLRYPLGKEARGHWTLDDSPVIVSEIVHVPESDSLIIEAGVQVLFDKGAALIVDPGARLQVNGDEEHPVRFESLKEEDSWSGITVEGGLLHMEHAQVFGADSFCVFAKAPEGNDETPIRLRHCTFDGRKMSPGTGNAAIMIWDAAKGLIIIDSCRIDSVNGRGLDLRSCIVFMTGDTVQDCAVGPGYFFDVTGEIVGCRFAGRGQQHGFLFDGTVCDPFFRCCEFENLACQDEMEPGEKPEYATIGAIPGTSPVFGWGYSDEHITNVISDSSATLLWMYGEYPLPVVCSDGVGSRDGLNDWYQWNDNGGVYITWIEHASAYKCHEQFWNREIQESDFYPNVEGLFAIDPPAYHPYGLCGYEPQYSTRSGPRGRGGEANVDDLAEDIVQFEQGLTVEASGDYATAHAMFCQLARRTGNDNLRWQSVAHVLSTLRHLPSAGDSSVVVPLVDSLITTGGNLYQVRVHGNRVLTGYHLDRRAYDQAISICTGLLQTELTSFDSVLVALDLVNAQLLRASSTGHETLDDAALASIPAPFRVQSKAQGLRLHSQLLGQLGQHRGTKLGGAPIPRIYKLYQNYPNPFNPNTEIRFDLPEAVKVHIKIFNSLGQEVATLIDEVRPAGAHRVIWDSKGASSVQVASGVYIYQIKAGSFVDSKKMVLIR